MNRSIQKMTMTMLNKNTLSKYFSIKVVNTAFYVLNRVLIRPYLIKTPCEHWKDKNPTLVISKFLDVN